MSTDHSGPKIAALNRRVATLESENGLLRSKVVVPIAPEMKPVRKGYVAEAYVRYILARRGFEYFEPPPSSEACDLLVSVGQSFFRCEIKASTTGTASGRRTLYEKRNSHSSSCYSEQDKVDFFLFLDLTQEHIFVVPADKVYGKPEVCLSPKSWVWAYKDRFDLLACRVG